LKEFILDSDAENELDEAVRWYNKQRSGLGLELFAEVEQALGRIYANQAIGANYRNTNFRFYHVERFPYVIDFQDLPAKLWIAAIAHASRRPGYWRKRKPPGP
jgi:toxin ParE1/3/4